MKYIYIINQFHLKEKAPLLIEKLETVSKQLHRDYEICVNATPKDVKKTLSAFKDSENIITCVGGDGSINLLLNDLIGTKNILSFIPQGTGNDFYHYCKDNLSDGFHDVDIIRINDRYFINVACFGIDADIANDDNFIHNRFIPRSMRYNAGVVYYFLTYKARAMKIKVNDQLIEKDFTTVVAGNAQYYGNGYHVTPNGDVKDGVMEVLLADKVNKAAMAKLILSMKDSSPRSVIITVFFEIMVRTRSAANTKAILNRVVNPPTTRTAARIQLPTMTHFLWCFTSTASYMGVVSSAQGNA